ncbi:ubiquitin-associated protein 2-like isoform X3 [Erpetoichthys calabaricus]|uniref:ubiquitin-associated protein 2-like isoform X3 n=1 Tax=Erpetoichthys calabaricus TaxID=27687 RepID=UPI00223441C8|nr:ubiquitin-associated protein 2-like isoform X3 [Erpetoichthys calabaricus]
MMTSVGSNRARGTWEQTQTQSQTQHKQRPQATAEQIRLAQMISDHNDADFEEKVKQLIEVTGKNQDECMIALHDCNGDVNRAINVLLEGNPDTDSWEMVGKKKGVSGQKESGQSESNEEGKENRERERDLNRRRGPLPRRGRGSSRGREFRGQENGLEGGKSGGPSGRGSERGRRGRGRGRGGSGRRGGRFSAQGMGTFNPADYAEPTNTEDNYGNSSNTWNSTGSYEPEDCTGAWRTAAEEWGTEDWSEDLSETKIFTASNVASMSLPPENVTITAGQRIDLAVLLGKTPTSENETGSHEAAQPPPLSQSLVFNNSKQSTTSQPSSGTSFSQHNMVSMLGKSFGDVGEPKGGSTSGTTSGSQFLEQFKTAQALAQLTAQHTQASAGNPTSSSWEIGSATQSSSLGQFEIKTQSEASVHNPFSKRQSYQSTTSMMEAYMQQEKPSSIVSAPLPSASVPPSSSPLPTKSISSSAPQVSPGSSDNQSSSPQPTQQHKLKQQKKRTAITTKIPSSAVEMPGTSDIGGLNLQFGAMDFGPESVLPEYETTPVTSAPVSQVQNSPYTSAANESTTTIPTNQSQDSGYQSSAIPSSSYTSQQQNSSQNTLYEQRSTQTRRYPSSISSSPQKDLTQSKWSSGVMNEDPLAAQCNGFSSIQSTQSIEAAAGPAVKPVESPVVSSMASLPDSVSGSSSLLTTANQHATLNSLNHNEELPSTTTPASQQHNSSLSSQQNSLSSSSSSSSVRTSTSTLLHTNVESEPSLHSSASTFSSSPAVAVAVSSMVTAAPPAVSTVSSSIGTVSSLGITLSSNSAATPVSTRSSIASSSGKAPPNLPPGVPPLLPNPYIMAPGLLHYPPQVYGYDDLQMLQTRIPLDYYSIPFATPTTALTGRDATLTNNPYSGDLTKFGRGDASSPAPATTLAQPQQNQTQTHHTTQQTFLNTALPPGYSYTSLPYYTGVPGLPNTFQYGPAMFPVAPASSKQHGVNVSVNTSATPFQQASGYGSHGYSTGYEDLSQGPSTGDFCKGGYSAAVAAAAAAAAAASAQNKPAAATSVTGPGAGVSVTSSNTGVPDISGSVYTKTQSFDKQGFHAGTPAASFNLPSALGSGGHMNPATPAGYPPAPFMHILATHQQPHSQMLHAHLQPDGQHWPA